MKRACTHTQIAAHTNTPSSTHTCLRKTNDSPSAPLHTHSARCAISPVFFSRGKLYQTTEFTWPGESAVLNPSVSPNWTVGDWSSMPSVCMCVSVCTLDGLIAEAHLLMESWLHSLKKLNRITVRHVVWSFWWDIVGQPHYTFYFLITSHIKSVSILENNWSKLMFTFYNLTYKSTLYNLLFTVLFMLSVLMMVDLWIWLNVINTSHQSLLHYTSRGQYW